MQTVKERSMRRRERTAELIADSLFYLIVLLVIVTFLFALQYGLKKNDEVKCLQWQEYAQDFPTFYLTKAQQSECDSVGVNVWQYVD